MREFNIYLTEQVGQPYLWGGQHTELTPQNYEYVIKKHESDKKNRERVIKYCKKLFDAGATVLYAYDCSGLGMYWLQNVMHIYDHDMSANGMMKHCKTVVTPHNGDWVFRLSEGKATHVGYMVSDTEVIHAKGRDVGVVKEKYKKSYWHTAGTPDCFEPHEYEILVKGSVNVREGNGVTSKKICTVKNCRLPYLGQATESPYWYMTEVNGRTGYITSKPKYTKLVEV